MGISNIRAASVLTVLSALTAVGLSACQIADDKPCSEGEYPARERGGGGMCFPNGQPPTSPYETYPSGYTPTTVPNDNPAPDATDYGESAAPTP